MLLVGTERLYAEYGSIVAGDFYKMPITVAFVISSIVAIAISKGGKLSNRIEQFCRGAANSNIMLMEFRW